MQQLIKDIFCGSWKSYKSFFHSGKCRLHSVQHHLEFIFEDDQTLTIHQYEENRKEKRTDSKRWKAELQKRKYFLLMEGEKGSYEIISVNHTDMVLQDTQSGEKIFFVKPAQWQKLIKQN